MADVILAISQEIKMFLAKFKRISKVCCIKSLQVQELAAGDALLVFHGLNPLDSRIIGQA
jgi:hypothetical protein